MRSPTYAASITCRYDSFPTFTCETPSSGGFPFSPICARIRRASLRSGSVGGFGGLVMRSRRNQSQRREERATTGVVLEPHGMRTSNSRPRRNPEIDPTTVDNQALVTREPGDVPREL